MFYDSASHARKFSGNISKFQFFTEEQWRATNQFIKDCQKYARVMGVEDADRLLDIPRKAMVSRMFGSPRVNMEKHGVYACRLVGPRERFLTVKNVSIHRDAKATWNDLTEDSLNEVCDDWNTVVVCLWDVMTPEVLCVSRGNNPNLRYILASQIKRHKSPNIISISIRDAVNRCGFQFYRPHNAPAGRAEAVVREYFPRLGAEVHELDDWTDGHADSGPRLVPDRPHS